MGNDERGIKCMATEGAANYKGLIYSKHIYFLNGKAQYSWMNRYIFKNKRVIYGYVGDSKLLYRKIKNAYSKVSEKRAYELDIYR